MYFNAITLLCLGLLLPLTAFAAGTFCKNYFAQQENGLYFANDDWSIRAEGDLGFTSLKVKDAEFLYQGKTFGGITMQDGDKFITYYPDRSNISHDRQAGMLGAVSNGIQLIRVAPDWVRPAFELYAGYNAPNNQRLIIFLNDDVSFIRIGQPEDRSMMRTIVTRQTTTPVKADQAVIIHQKGYSLRVTVPCLAGMFTDPEGKARLALAFDVKGFAANSIPIIVEPLVMPENFVLFPQFNVNSSDDDPKMGNQFNGAAGGVQNPVYTKETKLDFTIEFTLLGDKPFTGFAELDVVHTLGPQHFLQKVPLNGVKADKDGKIVVRFTPKFSMPGVSDLSVRLVGENDRLIWTDRYRMAYEIEQYHPKILVQPDFKQFWDNTLQTLRATPLDAVTERVAEYADFPKWEIYQVSFNSWDGKRIYALLYVPKERTGPLPAIITAHPGTLGFEISKRADGTYGSEVRQDPRCVTIVPLIRGFKPDAKDIPFNNPWWGPLEDRDSYVARSWYCALVRAVDYLATRPDLVDMKRVIAAGGSQGGALALVTAALDHRIAYCFADCPSNCQPQEIMEHYGTFGPSKGVIPPGKTLQETENLLSYYNPANFSPLITCPTYVGSNIGDLTVHSMGPIAAYRNLTSLTPAQKAFYPGFTHSHGSGPGLYLKQQEIIEKITAQK